MRLAKRALKFRKRKPDDSTRSAASILRFMTPKNAALLAFIGTLLLTILVTFDFVNTVSGVLRDIVPVMALVRSLIYLLASVTVTLFFFLFYKA